MFGCLGGGVLGCSGRWIRGRPRISFCLWYVVWGGGGFGCVVGVMDIGAEVVLG